MSLQQSEQQEETGWVRGEERLTVAVVKWLPHLNSVAGLNVRTHHSQIQAALRLTRLLFVQLLIKVPFPSAFAPCFS